MTLDPPVTSATDVCVTDLLGAYVLGACAAAEADAVEAHLGRCPVCTAEAAGLQAAGLWARESSTEEPAGGADLPADGPGSLAAVLTAALAVRPAAPGMSAAGNPPLSEIPLSAGNPSGSGELPGQGGLPAQGSPTGPGAACYAHRVGALDRLLVKLGPEHWPRPAAAGWSVRELVLHLFAVDGLPLAALSGIGPDEDPLARTDAVLDAARDWPVEMVWRRWSEQAARLRASADQATRRSEPTTVTAGGWTATADDHLIARAFETWIHTRDIGATAGIAIPDPGEDDLRAMADLSLRLLAAPWSSAAAERSGQAGQAGQATGAALTVTLTGPGGGTWSLRPDGAHAHRARTDPRADRASVRRTPPTTTPTAPTAPLITSTPAAATLVTDIVEFCLLVGGRLSADAVNARIEGDKGLATELLALAPSLSGP